MRLTRRAVMLLLLLAVVCVCLLAVGLPRYLSSKRAGKPAAHPFTLTVFVPSGERVLVSVLRLEGLLLQQETSSGKAVFKSNLEPGTYWARAEKAVDATSTERILSYRSFSVGTSENSAEITFSAFPVGEFSVSCVVVDENEKRVPGATISFRLDSGNESAEATNWVSKTDHNGMATVTSLVEGSYEFFARLKDGEADNDSGMDKYSPDVFIQVSAGSTDELFNHQPVPMMMQPVPDLLSAGPYTLTARWRDEDHVDPVTALDSQDKASVFAVSLADGARYAGKTSLGAYEFFHLRPGKYQVSVNLPTGEYGTRFVTMGEDEAGAAQVRQRSTGEGECRAGETCSEECCCPVFNEVFLPLSQGPAPDSTGSNELGVVIVDSNGSPVVGQSINISIKQLDGNYQRDFSMQGANQAWAHNLPPGKYLVSISDESNVLRGTEDAKQPLASAEIVEIRPASTEPISKLIEIKLNAGSLDRRPRSLARDAEASSVENKR